jgi:hypothetical protein
MLIAEIYVNHTKIGEIIMIRLDPLQDKDAEYNYRVARLDFDTGNTGINDKTAYVKHKYSDGALILIKRAIEALT